jgi:drug/metabolite transporter (DMT)-like permease
VTFRKYLVLAAMVVLGSLGDLLLKRGMSALGPISIHDWTHAITALFNPWVAAGVVLLIGFFAAYSSALSWADLTYVMPATSLGYVLIALLSVFVLHEDVSLTRWLGIILISSGVAVIGQSHNTTDKVAHGPEAIL